MPKRQNNNKRNKQNNFAKLSIFQPNKYKFKKNCPLSVKGAPKVDYKNNPYSLMLATLPVRDIAYSLIPACIHVDGTSRVQSVDFDSNPLFHKLISAFYAATDIPALLNTSFNLRGEPMVNNMQDCINTFERSGMDALIIEKRIFLKK